MEGSPPERDVLLATKLQVPRSRPGLVPRRRLADRLEEGLNRGLVLVAAPAGYGKSVLLSEWVRGMTEPVAWLSLDGGDNDPVRFWRHVLAALDMVRPGIAERVSPLAGPPAPPAYDSLVSALINEVAAEPDQPGVLLVLDDYHLISSDSVQESVRFLLAHRPPQLRVVLASRSDPPLGLARYRGRGELGEVRAADLRFNLDEAAELLRQASADLDLSIAAAQQRAGSLIEIRALRAMALAALGDEAAAIAALTSALDLGCSQGYVRVFADEGPAMAAVLGRLIPAQLTSRELEVLAMLAAGRSNQGIASHLVISLDTVKKHVSHLMGKLGAANRTEAVARGRELGLID